MSGSLYIMVAVKAPFAANDAVASGEDNHSSSVDCFDVGGWYSIGAVGLGVTL
jgi:hypothetical protein